MITEYVLFDIPPGTSRADVVAGMHEVAPRWQAEPDLIRKTFVYDAANHQAGAFYLWRHRAAAEAAHDAAWRQRIRTAYGSDPVIRYFETPLVVDNALGGLVVEGEGGGAEQFRPAAPARPGAQALASPGATPPVSPWEIRPVRPSEMEACRLLLQANHWGPRVADAAIFADLVRRSPVAIVAVERGQVIGFLRALTDGLFNGYISMVVVDQAHRGQGVGTALVRSVMGDRPEMTWVLRAGRDGVSAFYEKIGFQRSGVAMERPGRRD